MAFAYQSLEPGAQVIVSDERREDLEELARWVSIDVPETAPKLTAAEKKAAKAEAEAAAAAELEAAGVAAAEVEAAAKAAADLAAAGDTDA